MAVFEKGEYIGRTQCPIKALINQPKFRLSKSDVVKECQKGCTLSRKWPRDWAANWVMSFCHQLFGSIRISQCNYPLN